MSRSAYTTEQNNHEHSSQFMFAEEGETFFSGVAFSCTPITSPNYTQWVEKNKYINKKNVVDKNMRERERLKLY